MTDRTSMLLIVHQALLGEVTPGLRAVSVRLADDHLRMRIVFDHPPTDDEVEDMQVMSTNVAADLDPSILVDEDITHLTPDAPLMSQDGWTWVYLRKEPESPWAPGPWHPDLSLR